MRAISWNSVYLSCWKKEILLAIGYFEYQTDGWYNCIDLSFLKMVLRVKLRKKIVINAHLIFKLFYIEKLFENLYKKIIFFSLKYILQNFN